jgi:hypothetical protein
MAAETADCDHLGVVPIPVYKGAILEGHAELLGAACERCGHTVIGLYTNNGPSVEWITVGAIVRKVRRYRRQAVVRELLGTPGPNPAADS